MVMPDYEVGKLTKVERSYIGKGCTPNYEVEVTWGHDTEEPKVEELSFIWSEYIFWISTRTIDT